MGSAHRRSPGDRSVIDACARRRRNAPGPQPV